MFRLPPGRVRNGVWASTRAELVDVESVDAGPVPKLLADAHVGGYVAAPSGESPAGDRS